MKGMRLVVVLLVLGSSAGSPAADMERLTQQCRTVTAAFMQELKGALRAALADGGPVHAVTVCNREAPEIAGRLSERTGWQVGRTSLRVRNPANSPDRWEREILRQLDARRARGESPGELEYGEVVEEQGRSVFRYMKAISTAGICLTCHGKELQPELRARILELYPKDQATSFAVGDLRGAFTLRRTLTQ
jgi:hypothetical protein